ncbi:hypothetical protein [Pseudonocardia sp. H11422]|uniref:hypothetical protein n=1 Tax=Pseudonocardia sp. H11422 TaxID=2835866 RepID=UPI001BDCD6F1|nr:hypothetical protein [Pseudonocardia sp. H11422]
MSSIDEPGPRPTGERRRFADDDPQGHDAIGHADPRDGAATGHGRPRDDEPGRAAPGERLTLDDRLAAAGPGEAGTGHRGAGRTAGDPDFDDGLVGDRDVVAGDRTPGHRTDGDHVVDEHSGHGGHSDTAPAGRHDDGLATLIPHDRSADYRARWEALKAEFVDEPRAAVQGADQLVGQVLDEVEDLFRRQRGELERDLNDDQASTEDLRLALGRYRSFFDRLLSF